MSIQNKKCSYHKKLSFINSFPSYLIMAVESVNYDCAVPGYPVQKCFGAKRIYLARTKKMIYTMFSIKTCLTDENGKEQIVRHLPLELSRFTTYLLERGAVVTAKLTSTHYRRSVLVQEGLEIPSG